MWAQIIMMRLKPGMDDELAVVMDQLKSAEQADSGLLRTTTMRDQRDPSSHEARGVLQRDRLPVQALDGQEAEPVLQVVRVSLDRVR
jgi:hypothetical protein